jgi:IS5 family transposase
MLAELDRYLDDPRFFEPFRPYFHPADSPPSVPMETYLRMMVLKYRYRLGFEPLCAEVSGSTSWRRSCRVPFREAVPHPSTLERTTVRCGQGAVDALNEALLAKAAEGHLVKFDKLRADTTVVPANVTYPPTPGCVNGGAWRLAVLTSRLKSMGLAATKRRKIVEESRSPKPLHADSPADLRTSPFDTSFPFGEAGDQPAFEF